MANVVQHITGVADEISFAGFGGFDDRDDFLPFGEVDALRRAFQFERTGTDAAVIFSFNPSTTGVDPGSSGEAAIQTLSKVVAGTADEDAAFAFQKQWHGRVQRTLDEVAYGGPFTVENIE